MNARSLIPARVMVGPYAATFVWGTHDDVASGDPVSVGAIPAGLVIHHLYPTPHKVVVAWAAVELPGGAPHFVFTLESLVPLTVREPVACLLCGVVGRIVTGAWVPAESGGIGG